MSIAVEFQTDLISFGKTVLQYHTYDKDMIFNENDYVIFISSSGRSLEGFMYTRTNLSLQNTTSLLVTQIQPMQERNLQLIQFKYQEDLMALISIIK